MSVRIPQPIPYQGSKRKLAKCILQKFPVPVLRLVEPFAGSAAVSIAAATGKYSNRFWINDANKPLMDLWREIINKPEDLVAKYTYLWNDQIGREKEYFHEIRSRFNKTHNPSDFLYLLARCVKAAIRYNSNGEFNNTADNRRRGARPTEMEWRISKTSQLLKNRTKITSEDYKEVLMSCTENDLIYMDPPYQGVCTNRNQRYMPPFDHNDFYDSLSDLNKKDIMFAVSYDGRTGSKTYGSPIPDSLNLTKIELYAGRSTQATLLGRSELTYESLYLSTALVSSFRQRPRITENELMLKNG